MKQFKDILEKGLGKKWSLTEEEKSSLWESVSSQLPSAEPKRGGFLWWAVPAAVAAAVAAFFLLRSPSSSPTPFQPEITPIEKTTTLADGNGAIESAESPTREKEAQMPVLAYSGTPKKSAININMTNMLFQRECQWVQALFISQHHDRMPLLGKIISLVCQGMFHTMSMC